MERVVSEVTKDAIGARQTRHSRTKPESEPVPGMDGLIPVFRTVIGGREVDVVNARDLHAFLEVGKDFSTWIKDRIRKYGFEENQDFEVFTKIGENPQGGRPSLEYHLTLDMAKELSMVENNERGRQARRYFIEVERRYYSASAQASHSLPEPEQPVELPGDSVDSRVGDDPSPDSPIEAQESPFAADDREILYDFPNLLDALLPDGVTTESFLRSAQAFYRAHLLLNPETPNEDLIRQAFARAAELCGADLKRIAEAIAGPCKKRWF